MYVTWGLYFVTRYFFADGSLASDHKEPAIERVSMNKFELEHLEWGINRLINYPNKELLAKTELHVKITNSWE